MQGFVILVVMSKSELLQQLATLSREDLDDVAERIDELRGAPLSQNEQMLIRERVAHYRANPHDVVDLDEAISEIRGQKK